MKPRNAFYVMAGLLIVFAALIWIYSRTKDNGDIPAYNATVNMECAPWDGAAFRISIPYKMGSVIGISIWQTPDIKAPVDFSFPDQTGHVGDAVYQPQFVDAEQLSGTVTLQTVGREIPVEGRFNFTLAGGESFNGKFKAQWGNQIMLCG